MGSAAVLLAVSSGEHHTLLNLQDDQFLFGIPLLVLF